MKSVFFGRQMGLDAKGEEGALPFILHRVRAWSVGWTGCHCSRPGLKRTEWREREAPFSPNRSNSGEANYM